MSSLTLAHIAQHLSFVIASLAFWSAMAGRGHLPVNALLRFFANDLPSAREDGQAAFSDLMAAAMSMRLTHIAAAASALAFSFAPFTAAPATNTDWTRTVTDTGTGWRMGSPKAATQLVEYGSFNCPHCAAFEKAAMPAIRKLVASGKMSFEFRPKQIFPHDPSATLLAQCVGKSSLFAFTEDYMANAPAVLGRLRAAYKNERSSFDAAEAAGAASIARLMAKAGGMVPIAQRHGVTAARADACLGDAAMIARVEANEEAALAAGVKGTPSFFISGKRATPAEVEALGLPLGH